MQPPFWHRSFVQVVKCKFLNNAATAIVIQEVRARLLLKRNYYFGGPAWIAIQ